MTAENRLLYSSLNRQLALKLTCEKLAELLQGDEALAEQVIKACQQEAEASQQLDPARLSQLRTTAENLSRSIQFNMRHGGDNEEEEAEVAHVLATLRRERAGVMAEISALEASRQRPAQVPGKQAVRSLLGDLGRILTAAATGDVDHDAVLARGVIEALTGGRIDLFQQGERKAKRGWLQGRFRVRLIDYCLEKATGVPPCQVADSIKVVIDYRRPVAYEAEAERAKELYDRGFLGKQIAQELGCCRARVTNLLDYAFRKHGETKPDGRKRRGGLPQKQTAPARYQEIADQATSYWETGLSVREISRRLDSSDATVWKALAYWHRARGQAEAREEAVQEVICNACCAYARLVELKKTSRAYPTALARFGVRQTKDGRRVGGRLNIRDLTSEYCRQRKNLLVERLDRFDREEECWREIVVEDRHAGPAEVAVPRIDFAAWLRSLPNRLRRIATYLANGERTSDAAKKFRLSPARISQIRHELCRAWRRFQGEDFAFAIG